MLTGSTDGKGRNARFNLPLGIAVDCSGNVYVADTLNNTIRKITCSGEVTTFAGMAGSSGSADGKGRAARFSNPRGLAVDRAGNVYVADAGNCTIRKIAPNRVVTTLAGTAGVIGWADGEGGTAQFCSPCSVAVDSEGNVYVADTGTHTIRSIDPDGVVTTIAGTPFVFGSTDGLGDVALFNQPYGLAVDGWGDTYVADTSNNTIRKGIRIDSDLLPTTADAESD